MKLRKLMLVGVAGAAGLLAFGAPEQKVHLLPPGAASAGFTKCVINEQPKVEDISPDRKGTHKWYSGQWYNYMPKLEKYKNVDGALAMEWNGDLVSAPQSFREEPGLPYLPGKDGFYVEFEVSLSDNDPDHFPAVWIMPVEKNQYKETHTPGEPGGFERWMELDVDEGGFGPGMCGTVHNWFGRYPNYHQFQNPNNLVKAPLDRSKKHTFGVSYSPKTCTVVWWLDNQRMHHAGPPYVPEVAEKHKYYLIMGAQVHSKVKPYTMYVHAVRAFVPQHSELPAVKYKP